jgi:hypothetical protein
LQFAPRVGVLTICSLPCSLVACSTCCNLLILIPWALPSRTNPLLPSPASSGGAPAAASPVHYCTPFPFVLGAARWAGLDVPFGFCFPSKPGTPLCTPLCERKSPYPSLCLSDLACRHGCVVALFTLDYPFARSGVCSVCFCFISSLSLFEWCVLCCVELSCVVL